MMQALMFMLQFSIADVWSMENVCVEVKPCSQP
jgi:hypothetical protein